MFDWTHCKLFVFCVISIMVKHRNARSGKHDNLKQLRECVEKFASQHLPTDGTHSSTVSTGRRKSRKVLRKEARKLKKMRIHAFKQGKPVCCQSISLYIRLNFKLHDDLVADKTRGK
jgi:hypothetical protein